MASLQERSGSDRVRGEQHFLTIGKVSPEKAKAARGVAQGSHGTIPNQNVFSQD